MRSTRACAVLCFFAVGVLAGSCRRCPPCPPTVAAAGLASCQSELPEATRQAVVRRLRVGMTNDEVRAALRPFADREPGVLGRFGSYTFELRDGDLHLQFAYDGQTTYFHDGPADGSFTDRVPPLISGESDSMFRLIEGGDFRPSEGR